MIDARFSTTSDNRPVHHYSMGAVVNRFFVQRMRTHERCPIIARNQPLSFFPGNAPVKWLLASLMIVYGLQGCGGSSQTEKASDTEAPIILESGIEYSVTKGSRLVRTSSQETVIAVRHDLQEQPSRFVTLIEGEATLYPAKQ